MMAAIVAITIPKKSMPWGMMA
jgi:hypothetical protein